MLTLLQQVAQLGAVQRSPTHTPVKVIDGLALGETHTDTQWKTRAEAVVAVNFTAMERILHFKITKNSCCQRASGDKHTMQNELLFLV